MRVGTVVAAGALALSSIGCATPEPREVIVTFELDRFATAFPIVDGVPYRMTDEERDRQAQLIVDAYCPVAHDSN